MTTRLTTASQLAQISKYGKRVCANLPANPDSLDRKACSVMEDTIVPPFPTPYIFQLSRVIQATSLAARYSGNALQSSFANAAYSAVLNHAYNGHIHNGLTPGGGNIRFYDDNAWTGQMFVQLYHQTGEAKFLDAAKQELTFERTGQVKGGGLIWNTGTTKISAGSTGGASSWRCNSTKPIKILLGLASLATTTTGCAKHCCNQIISTSTALRLLASSKERHLRRIRAS